MAGLVTDHSGKVSQGRVTALMCAVTACAWVISYAWFGGEAPDPQMLAMLLGIPNGLAVWQKVGAPAERPREDSRS